MKAITAEQAINGGAPIPDSIDSNISDDGIEVVIRDSAQALPSFLIHFSVPRLQVVDRGKNDFRCDNHQIPLFR